MSGKVVVIIPALNEEDAILRVLNDIPDLAHEVIVVDNGSMDDTPARAAAAGALNASVAEPTPEPPAPASCSSHDVDMGRRA